MAAELGRLGYVVGQSIVFQTVTVKFSPGEPP
jgi:hypothetical protein